MTGIATVIEDSNGDVDRLQLYNQSNDFDVASILSSGQVVAIKEPYYKVSADGGYSIRVDHPSDIVLLSPTDSLISSSLGPNVFELDKTALEWKDDGNAAYKRKDYFRAIELCVPFLQSIREVVELVF